MVQTAMPSADPRRPAVAPERPGVECVPELTGAIARGDTVAFGEFYEVWFDRAFSMARSVSKRDESFCLDVVQDTMMRAVKYMKPMPSEKALTNWMARGNL